MSINQYQGLLNATLESINLWIDSKSSSVDPVATYRILVAHFVVITGSGLAGTTR